jgi:AcrR family transcriptional regulator
VNVDRRQQYREQTRQEAKRIALEQLAEDGLAGISVNAIGKRMGITGPALYRYFANRDALLTELISDGYHDLADTVERAIASVETQRGKLWAAARAMRDWAVAAPHRYMLLFGTPVPGYEAPAHTLDAANRTMTAILSTVGEDTVAPADGPLERQLIAWGTRMGHGNLTARQQHFGLVGWSRLHGHLSLEVTGQFALTGVDPELLFDAEVEALVAWWAPES